MTWEEMYDCLCANLDVTQEALDLAFAVGGCNQETAERILFYYTGVRTFKDYLGETDEEEDE